MSKATSIRMDEKFRYGIEMLSRLQKRSMTATVEWAVQKAIDSYTTAGGRSLGLLINDIWAIDEPTRFVNQMSMLPEAASYDDQRLWETIRYSPVFWLSEKLDMSKLRSHWADLIWHIRGDTDVRIVTPYEPKDI